VSIGPSGVATGPYLPYDVAIAGAGLAGASLALRLATAGARVALIDSSVFPRQKLCGEFLSPECWGVLDRLGLSQSVSRLGFQPVRRVRLTTPNGRVLEAEFNGRDGLPGIGISRLVLDDLIVSSARAAGVEVIEGARINGPVVRQGRVAGVVARRGAGPPLEVLATVTVAADGRHSALVQRTGTTRTRSRLRPGLFGLKCHVAVTDPDPGDSVELHLIPGGYVGACRVENGLTNLCGLLPESALRSHRGDLTRLAAAVFPLNPCLNQLWTSGRAADGWKTISGVRVQSSTPSLPGILYVGDARGTIDPLGGQGMTMALLGAEIIVPFIKSALVEGGAGESLQRDFSTAWHRRFDRRVALCRGFHHVLMNPWLVDLTSALRTVGPRLLSYGFNLTRDSLPA
jgi:flavin-dependent dehydrogenase